MKKTIDARIGQKFALATATLMTRLFSTAPQSNPRRTMFAFGVEMKGPTTSGPTRDARFDVVGLGFRPGRERKGPTQIFVEEMRDGQEYGWRDCNLWCDAGDGPLYLLTEDPDVSFSFDGNALVALGGQVDDRAAGISRARVRLREAARLVPDDLEGNSMM